MIDRIRSAFYRALRATEPYTKTDMVYLAKGGFWLGGSQIITYAVSFALAIAFANLVPKEVYGQYKYILSLAGLLTTISLTGIGAALIQSIARGNQGDLKIAFWVNIKWSIPLFLIGGSAGVYYLLKGNMVLALSLIITVIALPLLNSALLYQSFLNGIKDFQTLTYYAIIRNVIPAPFLIGTLLFTHEVVVIVFVYYLTNTASAIYFYFRTLKVYKPNNQVDSETVKFGAHLSFMGVLGGIAEQIDAILVFHYLGAAELAIYTFATALPEQIRGVLKNIYPLMLPKLAERSNGELMRAFPRRLTQLVLLALGAVGAYIFMAPILFNLFFPQYDEAIYFSQLYAIIIISATAAILPMTLLQIRQDTRKLYIFSTVAQLITILVLFLGAYFFGIAGVIVGRITTELFKFLFLLLLV